MFSHTGLVIVAAGRGTRFGGFKQLAPISGVPLLGRAMATIGSAVTAAKGLGGIDPNMVSGNISMQSMNLLFQNSLLPGAGPTLAIPAQLLEDWGWYRSHVPDAVKNAIQPFVKTDPDADVNVASAFLPAWVQGMASGLGLWSSDKIKSYMPGAVAMLMQQNPDGRYWSTDETGAIKQTTQQQDALMRDAETLASGLLFGRSVVQNVSPGSPLPEVLYRADDGRMLATTALSQEYGAELRARGDQGEALLALADKYGVEALFTLMPTRGSSISPTGDAWEFVKGDPEMAEKYGHVLAIFAPGGGYSARFDRYQRQLNSNPELPDDQKVRGINGLLKEARQAELDRKLDAGQITAEEHEALGKQLSEAYADVYGPNFDTAQSEVRMSDVLAAANDPAFAAAFPQTAGFVKEYAYYRQYALDHNATESLEGPSNVEWRAWLRKKGTQMLAGNPRARVAWTRVFWPEVKED